MARRATPWYWKQRNQWFAIIDGKRTLLGNHPPDAPRPRKGKTGWNPPPLILEAFQGLTNEATPGSVEETLFDFVKWSFENKAYRTAARYKDFCHAFAKAHPGLLVSQLSPAHLSTWLTKQSWNSTTKRNAITAIQRAFNWAVKNRGLRFNPIRGMEKPKANTPKKVLTEKDFDTLISLLPDKDPFRDLMIVSYDSFCRPQEIKQLEVRHLQLKQSRAVLSASEAKGGRTRVIYFPTARSISILKRLSKLHPTGPIFLNARGTAWTGFSVKCRFERLEQKLGKRLHHYMFRRTGITRAIINGVDSHVVAKLAGHETTAMIDKHYSAIADDAAFMLQQAKLTK